MFLAAEIAFGATVYLRVFGNWRSLHLSLEDGSERDVSCKGVFEELPLVAMHPDGFRTREKDRPAELAA